MSVIGARPRRHAQFVLLLLVGAVLRLAVFLAYRPALFFYGDSYDYVVVARLGQPGLHHPFGYSLVVRLLAPALGWEPITLLQHLLGLGLGVVIYAVLLRRGVRSWLAALAAAPVLLDAYQVALEQFVLAETLFEGLVMASLLPFLAARRLNSAGAAASGLALAAASLTRTVALPLVLPILIVAAWRRVGWARSALLLTAFAVPLALYALWFDSAHGELQLTGYDGRLLYGRVNTFAECASVQLPATETVLCDNRPPSSRPSANFYVWSGRSPYYRLYGTALEQSNVAGDFARRVILAEPLPYAETVIRDLVHYLAPGRRIGPQDYPVQNWRFRQVLTPTYNADLATYDFEHVVYRRPGVTRAHFDITLLAAYQRVAYTQGPLLAAAILAAFVVAGGWPRQTRPDDRAAAFLLAATSTVLLVVPAASAMFDYRYLVPVLPFAPPAGALAVEQFLRLRHLRQQPVALPRPEPQGG